MFWGSTCYQFWNLDSFLLLLLMTNVYFFQDHAAVTVDYRQTVWSSNVSVLHPVNEHFLRKHSTDILEVTQENTMWTHSHGVCSSRRHKTYTNKTYFTKFEMKSPVRKQQTSLCIVDESLEDLWRSCISAMT